MITYGRFWVFTEDSDPFCGIDLDRCRGLDHGVSPEAQTVIDRVSSYTELSPSGLGIHILVKAKLVGAGRRTAKLEVYDSGRYFTMTGRQLPESSSVTEQRQVQLDD